MNSVRLMVAQEIEEGTEDVLTFVRALVDGEDLAVYPELVVCFSSLFESFFGDGDHGILTCLCGVPQCAGVEAGIRQERLGRSIRWTLSAPRNATYEFGESEFTDAVHDLRRQLLELDATDAFQTWNHVPERNGPALSLFMRTLTPTGAKDLQYPFRRKAGATPWLT